MHKIYVYKIWGTPLKPYKTPWFPIFFDHAPQSINFNLYNTFISVNIFTNVLLYYITYIIKHAQN